MKKKDKYTILETQKVYDITGLVKENKKEHTTYAVSSKQALNNVRYKTGINKYNCYNELQYDGLKVNNLKVIRCNDIDLLESEQIGL